MLEIIRYLAYTIPVITVAVVCCSFYFYGCSLLFTSMMLRWCCCCCCRFCCQYALSTPIYTGQESFMSREARMSTLSVKCCRLPGSVASLHRESNPAPCRSESMSGRRVVSRDSTPAKQLNISNHIPRWLKPKGWCLQDVHLNCNLLCWAV